MPVRFRCYFCTQLLSIGQRKAGTVIQCPRCLGQVWVPDPKHPDAEQPPASGVPGEIILTPITDPAPPSAAGILWLSPRQIKLLLVVLIAVLVLLFGAGVWVGRAFWAA